MRWILITASPEVALYAEQCGVDQIMVDMETIGKLERQGHLSTHKAAHTLVDVAAVSSVLKTSELLVRVNPFGGQSGEEVEGAIAAGASRLMLPMFRSVSEVRSFAELVGGRLPVTWLVETPQALSRLQRILPEIGPLDRIHFGLNDLTLAMGLKFVFEPLVGGLLDRAAQHCIESGVEFGIGGIARLDEGLVSARLILGEHVRLGSCQAILSQAFHGNAPDVGALKARLDIGQELARLEAHIAKCKSMTPADLEANRLALCEQVFGIAEGAQ